MDDQRSMRELAQEALNMQQSVNLSQVVHSFSRCICRLHEIAKEEGWGNEEEIRQHPICVLFSARIQYLTPSILSGSLQEAYDWLMEETTAISLED
jgi:hypothetical protein